MTAQATQAKLHMRSRAAFAGLAGIGFWYYAAVMFTTPFARRLDEYLKTTSETSLDKPLKDSKLLSNKKVPKWLSELDDLGFVDSDTYRQFIDTAVAKGSLDEARTWAEKARAQGMPLTAQDLQSLISQALTTNDADAAKLWLEQTLSTEELTTHQKQKICFLAVFLVARKMGFGVLHDLLLKGGEEPSRWLRNKARWLLEILRATRSDGLEELGRRLDDALQVGVEADHSVFRYLLYEALKVPDFEYVTKWFTKAVRHGVVPETPIVNHIIGEARLGQVELEELGTSSRDDRDFQGFSSTSWGTPNLLWIFVQACFSQHFRWPRCRALLLLRTSSIVWYAGPCAKTTPKQPAGMV
ncbi:unnamed protein product [Durusdinium trenchii]|uniref:Uncharacterized protein n=1 Tax=Durusdinium trenchii TaxID=1381693 RepID=A0ABP0HXB5_9DINO